MYGIPSGGYLAWNLWKTLWTKQACRLVLARFKVPRVPGRPPTATPGESDPLGIRSHGSPKPGG